MGKSFNHCNTCRGAPPSRLGYLMCVISEITAKDSLLLNSLKLGVAFK